jgi:hypothetical protein
MPTNPSARRRRPAPSLPAPEPDLKVTIEEDATKAASIATDEQTTGDTWNDGIKGQATTAGAATNTPAADTAGDRSIRTAIAILVLELTLGMLAVSGLLLPLLATLVLALSPLYPILSLLGVLYLTFRLVYAVCQDLLWPLTGLCTALRILLAVCLPILALVCFAFFILLRSLVIIIFGIILGMLKPDERLGTFLVAFYQTLSRWFLELSNVFYPVFDSLSKPLKRLGRIGRWLLIAYTVWLGVTYTASFVFDHHEDALSTVVCATPYIAPQLILCEPRALDLLAGITLPRKRLADAGRRARGEHNLWQQMYRYRLALKSLGSHIKISHTISKERKLELDEPLALLGDRTETISKYVTIQPRSVLAVTSSANILYSRLLNEFTKLLRTTVGTMKLADDDNANLLDAFAQRTQVQFLQKTETVLDRVLARIHPLAGLKPANETPLRELKRSIKSTEKFCTERINELLGDADVLLTLLHNIRADFDRVKDIALKELGDTPAPTRVLQDLWVHAGWMKKMRGEAQGYEKLLGEIPSCYDVTSAMVRDIQSTLLQAKAGMELVNSPRIADALLETYPPHRIVTTLRKSAGMLEASKESIETTGTRTAKVIAKQKKGGG